MAKIIKFLDSALPEITNHLNNGKVISFTTETVYALSCSASDEEAIDRIYKIKHRSKHQALAVLVSSIEEIEKHAKTDKRIHILEKKFPGQLTYVLYAKNNAIISQCLIKKNKIGFRIPNSEIPQKILQNYSKPIVATSVNISNKPSALNVKDIDSKLLEQIDLVIDNGRCKLGAESTVVDLSNKEEIIILRRGCILKEEIERQGLYNRISMLNIYTK